MRDLHEHISELFGQYAPTAWEAIEDATPVDACVRCGTPIVARVKGEIRVRCSVRCNEGRVRPGSLRQLALRHGVTYTTVKSRIACGWSLERAVTTPARPKRRC